MARAPAERLVSVRLTPEDLAALDRLRAPTGLSRSGYLRHLLRRQAEAPDAAPWAAVLARLDQVLAAVQALERGPAPPAPAVAPEQAAALRASVAALAGVW
jgi:hypothetical protein